MILSLRGRTSPLAVRRGLALFIPPRARLSQMCMQALSTTAVDHRISISNPERQKRHAETMRQYLQRHGYMLANVNPLRSDGLLCDATTVKQCIPKSMIPLVDVLSKSREEDQNVGTCGNTCEFSAILKSHLLDSEHISICEEDAAVLQKFVASYCGSIGYEFEHCNTEAERKFFVSCIEKGDDMLLEAGVEDMDPCWMLEQLYRTESFERLLHERYSNARTFGIEGMEAAVLAVNTIIKSFSAGKKESRVLLGSSHRGRVNFVGNVLNRPWKELLKLWDNTNGPSYDYICDPRAQDVCIEIGSHEDGASDTCRVTLLPIPAHLEAMVPSMLGKARGHAAALAKERGETDSLATDLVLPISLHGDSSFCGQGIIQETLQLSLCQQYECGGTIHMILNNQVGFTTELSSIKSPRFRSTQSSDIMRSIGAPVLHVNANDPKAVVRACRTAVLYRNTFGADIMIDLVGWRKRGHNELDDPTMTNVNMYSIIDNLRTVTSTYQCELEESGDLSDAQLKEVKAKVDNMFAKAKALTRSRGLKDKPEPQLTTNHYGKSLASTSLSKELFDKALRPIISVPDHFTLHPLVERVVKKRRELLAGENSSKIDWATAELLALSSLAHDGVLVRLSGEDCERATFSQRHAVWNDARTGLKHKALPKSVEVCNSPLSELSVVGFEYGWSLSEPRSLVLWEAQFGDFSNEAQVIFDTIISSGNEKWGLESNLVLLLPHGCDGMGPDHSSCRPERWLQMFASAPFEVEERNQQEMYKACNLIIASPSDPANYFHLLRRQLSWPFRRPLVVMSPKRALRNPMAVSNLSDILKGGGHETFSPVLDDAQNHLKSSDVKGVLLCSGEVYFDLCKLRDQHESMRNTAIIRLEQLAPFPAQHLNKILLKYTNSIGMAFVQEEPANQGALSFVRDQICYHHKIHSTNSSSMEWISRPQAAAPAVGDPHEHRTSQEQIFDSVVEWSKQLNCQGQTELLAC